MKRSRKITAALGALTVVAALAGCSSQGGGSDNTLSIWTFKQSEVKALEVAGKAWGDKNNMKVKVSVYTPDDAYATKVQAAAKSKTLPDIVSVHSQGEDWKFAQAGIIQDLTNDFTDSWQKDFLPGVVKSSQLTADQIKNSGSDPTSTLKDLKADHFYSIPYLAGTPGVIFANKKTLEAAGVDSSKPPATWQEWIANIQKTRNADATNGGVVTGLQVPETGYFWLYRPLAYAYLGADAFYGRQGKSQDPAWTSAESVKTLDLYNELTPLWSPGVLGLGIDQADQAFASGKAAWDVGGTFTLSSLSTFGLGTEDVTVFPVPPASGGKITTMSYQASPLVSGAVTSTTKHKEQAVSFLKYLTSTEGAKSFAETAKDLPATKIPASSLSSPLLQQLVGLVTPADGATAFNPNDFSADPAGTIGHDTAVKLAQLPAGSSTVPALAATLSNLYKAAWAATK